MGDKGGGRVTLNIDELGIGVQLPSYPGVLDNGFQAGANQSQPSVFVPQSSLLLSF
jgi:hypothetical protein